MWQTIRKAVLASTWLVGGVLGTSATRAGPAPGCVDGAGANSTECGTNSSTGSATGATAVGNNAQSTGVNSVATGFSATSSNLTASSYGYLANASGIASSALGHNTVASGLASTAVGVSARAANTGATAIGRLSSATAAGSVALGAGSVADQANTVSVGAVGAERRIVNVAAGTASTDAVNLGQLDAVSTALGARIGSLQSSVDGLRALQDRDRRDTFQGIAAAIAIATAPMPSAPGRVSYALNGAHYRGENAVGGSLMYRVPGTTSFALGVGFSSGGSSSNAVRVSASGEF
jgi:autotransporter adhesin